MVTIQSGDFAIIPKPSTLILESLARAWKFISESQIDLDAANKLGCIETFCLMVWGEQAWRNLQQEVQDKRPNLSEAEEQQVGQDDQAFRQLCGERGYELLDTVEMVLKGTHLELFEILHGREGRDLPWVPD